MKCWKLHDSEEDARACIELLKRKVAARDGFGSLSSLVTRPGYFLVGLACKRGVVAAQLHTKK